LSAAVSLRPARAADRDLLLRVYASTREEELAPVPWTDEEKRAFMAQQFAAQDSHYREHYEGASFDVIVADGADVGRLYVDRWAREIRIMDITVLPAFRGRGIGSALLATLIEESDGCGKPLTIHVERQNPALAWYERLGFRAAEDRGVYLLLERPVGAQLKTAS
jgi:ribosomal protein S18 acetylase RimI-like enzyme